MHTRKFICAATTFLFALTGCGGGSSTASAPSATGSALALASTNQAAATTMTAAAVVNPAAPASASVVTYLDPGILAVGSATATAAEQRMRVSSVAKTASVTDTLTYTYDSAFSTLAPGWWVNWWGSSSPSYSAGRETRAAYINGGSASQMFNLTSIAADGAANLVYSYAFTQNTNYSISITVRAETAATVRFQYRLDGFPYTEIASQTLNLTSGWQTVNLQGVFPFSTAGSVRVIPQTMNTPIYIGNMTIAPQNAQTIGNTIIANAIPLLAQGSSAVSMVQDYATNMDSAFSEYADGWTINYWSTSAFPGIAASRETRPAYVYAGASSMKFQVTDKKGGEVQLIAPYAFVKGKTYHTTLYMRSDAATPMQVTMRADPWPYQTMASATVTASSTWQRVDLEGVWTDDGTGAVRVIFPGATGTIWVDEMTISEVVKNDLAPFSTATVPDTLFGMHVNKVGSHANWVGVGTKIVRLWDTGTTWRDIKPTAGAWDFTTGGGQRLDMSVDYVKHGDATAEIIYTLGQTPTWASSTPMVQSLYGIGAGGAPANMNDWRDYVRTLATRYAGKIHYWELWNEPDYQPHYNGSIADMVTMAMIAKQELLAADPNNKLISPGLTVGQGMPFLDAFLNAGGGAYVDMIGYHWYYSISPESIGASIDNVRLLMKAHGIQTIPLWNTEGAFVCDGATMNCSTATPTDSQSRSVNARAMFTMAGRGIQNFNYYYWESTDIFGQLVQADYLTPTAASVAYTEARSWLKGAAIVDAYKLSDSVYVYRLTRGGSNFVVLWSTIENQTVTLPSAWTQATIRSLTGVETAIATTRQIKLTSEPILLK